MVELIAGRDLSNGDVGVVSEKINGLETHERRTRCRSRRVLFLFDLTIGHVVNGHKMEDIAKIKGLEMLQKDLNGTVDTEQEEERVDLFLIKTLWQKLTQKK
jgi:hypothetical protein